MGKGKITSLTLGAREFLSFDGRIIPLGGSAGERITRPNVDGVSIRHLGKRGEPSDIVSQRDRVTKADIEQEVIDMLSIQGELVTVLMPTGEEYTNIYVVSFIPMDTIRVMTLVGGIVIPEGDNGFIKPFLWTFQATETA